MEETLNLICFSKSADKQPYITIIHLDLTPEILSYFRLVLFLLLQHSSKNIHPDGMKLEAGGCKQAVAATYKLWEKLENSVHWKNLLVTPFLLRSAPLISVVHQKHI